MSAKTKVPVGDPSQTFLSKNELIELTGYRIASAQIAWLRRNDFVVFENAAGSAKVYRKHFDEHARGVVAGINNALETESDSSPNQSKAVAPNFAALEEMVRLSHQRRKDIANNNPYSASRQTTRDFGSEAKHGT
jgi:Domain of unknown function (DUF4224)